MRPLICCFSISGSLGPCGRRPRGHLCTDPRTEPCVGLRLGGAGPRSPALGFWGEGDAAGDVLGEASLPLSAGCAHP